MTAIYDGRLLVRCNALEPCCAPMARIIHRGHVKTAKTKSMWTVKLTIDGEAYAVTHCPFCGAKVVVP